MRTPPACIAWHDRLPVCCKRMLTGCGAAMQVSLQEFLTPAAAGGLLKSLQRRLSHILRYSERSVSGGTELPGLQGLVRDAVWQLRLVACLFRTASRK